MVIVGAKHLGCHRLAKPPATRDATEASFREKGAVDDGHKPRLVNVFTVSYTLKPGIADVDINAHDNTILLQR